MRVQDTEIKPLNLPLFSVSLAVKLFQKEADLEVRIMVHITQIRFPQSEKKY